MVPLQGSGVRSVVFYYIWLRMRLKILLFFCCLLSCYTVAAQASRKSTRFYNKAQQYKVAKHSAKAYKKMAKAIRKSPSSPEAYSQLGRWYFEDHKFSEATATFKNASARCPDGAKRFAMPYAKSLLYAMHPDPALQLINTYATTKDSAEWNKMRAQADFIKEALVMFLSPWPVNLGVRINTSDPEMFPSIAADTETLYFTRRVNDMDDDIYIAKADSCGGWFGCDLYMSYRLARDSAWTTAQPFGSTINTPAYEGMPSLSPDNRELYFVSDREGGYGGYDIWISRLEDGI